jgi:hypothetical protein
MKNVFEHLCQVVPQQFEIIIKIIQKALAVVQFYSHLFCFSVTIVRGCLRVLLYRTNAASYSYQTTIKLFAADAKLR